MNIFINIKDFLYYNRKIFITIILLLLSGIYFLFYDVDKLEDEQVLIEENDSEVIKKQEEKEDEIKTLFVDVKGMVKNPGIYELTENDRVLDAINKAGGLLDNADTSSINLSMHLIDEMVIVIDKKKENNEDPINEIITNEPISNSKTPNVSNNTTASINTNDENKTTTNQGKISINKASQSELMKIKGIGEVKAKEIIEYREQNGLFKKIEDLKKVNGIGNATYEKIKDYITL